jgi:hypothetical protein
MRSVLDYSELRTPPGHGEVIVAPSPNLLPELAADNRQYLESHPFCVLDVSSDDCRRFARQLLRPGAADRAWIVTGHQPEFTHPGVWAKHVVTQRLADRVGGVAANLIVDHDGVKSTALMVPVRQSGRYHIVAVPFAPYKAGIPYESLPALSRPELEEFAARVKSAYGDRYDKSLMDVFFASAADVPSPADWVDQKVAGRRAIDALFGVRMLETRAHEVWGGPLLAQILLDAERFFTCYNEALDEYRRQLHIKGRMHPIPDLVRDGEKLELPMWAVRPGAPRQRVFWMRQGERIEVYAEDNRVGTVSAEYLRRWHTAQPALAEALSAGLRPRALTLTIWARLFLADVFVHGIGGAKYDRISDIFIRKYYDIEPPGICCVSATLRLDLPAHPVREKDLREVRWRIRDVRHNPQRYVHGDGGLAALLAERNELLARGNHLRQHTPQDRLGRRQVFDRIHQVNAKLVELDSGILERLAAEQARISRQLDENEVLRSREYFIGLFRREDLQYLCDRLPSF